MALRRLTLSRRAVDHLLPVVITLLWASSLVPLFDFAVADKRLLEAFSVDELILLNLLRKAVAGHTFAMTFGPYGHLVLNLTLVISRLIPGAVTDARLLYAGRAINLGFAIGVALFTFAWARRSYGRVVAWIAFSLILVNATFYIGVTEMQPDIAQIFFLMVALAFTVRRYEDANPRWLVLASAAAGLAFACKYSGLFVLPIIAVVAALRPVAIDRRPVIQILRASAPLLGAALIAAAYIGDARWIAANLTEDGRIDMPLGGLGLLRVVAVIVGIPLLVSVVMPSVWRQLRRWPRPVATVWSWYIAALTFTAAFVIASPYSLRKVAFIKGILGESAYAVPASIAASVTTLRDIGLVIGWPAALVALVTIVMLLVRRRDAVVGLKPVDAVLIAWIVTYLVVLLLPFHEFYLHYALPLVPPAAMLAGRGIANAIRAGAGLPPMARRLAALGLVAAVVAGEAPLAIALGDAREGQRTRTTRSDQAYVANWMQCHAPSTSRVAYDYFVWVPATFPHAFVTWGGTRAWLDLVNPDIVIVEKATAAYAAQQEDHRAYYACLAARTCGYEPAFEHGQVVVYARSGQAVGLTGRECS